MEFIFKLTSFSNSKIKGILLSMNKNNLIKNLFIFGIIFLLGPFVYAAPKCKTGENQASCRTRLLAEQKKLEQEVKKLAGDIKNENGKQKNLSGEISKLSNDIKKTSSAILKKDNLIKNIRGEINTKKKTLQGLNDKLRYEKESLGQIIRKRYELGDASLFELILSTKKISQFYEDVPAFSYIQSSLSDSFKYIAKLKFEIFGEKTSLESKKKQEDNARYSLKLEKGKIEVQKKDRNTALKVSKSKEATLASLKKKRENQIKQIRSALIRFQGNGISRSISFGDAYDYAKNAQKKTGVRAAFIMAIMQQETSFGNNVGGCYLKNGTTGDGIYIKSKKPSKRNMVPGHFASFLKITSALGRDWKTTPISCALKKKDGTYYGYGGAMGYTQFIPGTWDMVAARVRSYLGVTVANPWRPSDAVMATGIFLKDKGAATQTYTVEYNAACRYYGSCSSYASSVMRKAANIQKTIDTLERK